MTAPVASVDIWSGRSPTEPVGTIALPVRDHINAGTVTSLLQTDWSFLGSGTLDRLIIQGSMLPLQRNEAIQKMRGEWLLFIDDDMAWDADAIGKLVDTYHEIRHDFDDKIIVGGLCFRRTPPFQPTLYMRETPTAGGYNFMEDWSTDLVEVDATGCAFMLISKTALETMKGVEMPPYEVRLEMDRLPDFFRWTGSMGEDLRFCQDAKEAGVTILVDTRIEVRHVGEVQIGREHFLTEIATRDPVDENRRRMANTMMGLPTLTREEARRRLGWDSPE